MGKKKNNRKVSTKAIAIVSSVVVVLLISILSTSYVSEVFNGDSQWIYIDDKYSDEELRDSLKYKLGDDFGSKVYRLWLLQGGTVHGSRGAYKVEEGVSAWSISDKIAEGQQTPVLVTFNNVRTMSQLAQRISKQMQFGDNAFLEACDSVLRPEGFAPEEYPAAFFPDTYEFYWNASPQDVIKKLLKYYRKYWNEERLAKAKSLGLSPVEISTIASIVEEETNKTDERPKVARLYLNRLEKGMRLQADPTLKFAVGDFSIRRLLNEHIEVESPYNTYKNDGLPPGPIRIVCKETLEAVLNAPQHGYLFMCAKEDFSGYHNFAVDYATHKANANRYQAELNRRKIMK